MIHQKGSDEGEAALSSLGAALRIDKAVLKCVLEDALNQMSTRCSHTTALQLALSRRGYRIDSEHFDNIMHWFQRTFGAKLNPPCDERHGTSSDTSRPEKTTWTSVYDAAELHNAAYGQAYAPQLQYSNAVFTAPALSPQATYPSYNQLEPEWAASLDYAYRYRFYKALSTAGGYDDYEARVTMNEYLQHDVQPLHIQVYKGVGMAYDDGERMEYLPGAKEYVD